jgi:hypothetical protein
MSVSRRVDVGLLRLKDVYLHDPAAALTIDDAAALTQLEPYVCHALMDALADTHFLRRQAGTFVRDRAVQTVFVRETE